MPEKAYKLINSGSLILACTSNSRNESNIAPIAWCTPVEYDPVTKLLFVCDISHYTFKNVEETRQVIIAIPHVSQLKIVKDTGSCSGRNINKFEKFSIDSQKGKRSDILVPSSCIAYLECEVYNIVIDEEVGIIFCRVMEAYVRKGAFNNRLLAEKEEGKAIHHLGGNSFITTSDILL